MPTSEIRRRVELPCGYTATFLWPSPVGAAWTVEWEPDPPLIRGRRPRRKFMDAYKAARRSFLIEVAAATNGSIAVIDLDGSHEVVRAPTKQ
jgi:hypothetical protein